MRKQSHFYLPWKFIERDTSPEDFLYSFTPENIIEHRTFVLCSQIFSPLYFSVNQAIWQLTRGNNCIFTNSLQPIVNLFNFFFFNRGYSNVSSGSWSRRGCKTENYTSRRTYCSCDHLTHFAVLMQLKDHEVNIFKRWAQWSVLIALSL